MGFAILAYLCALLCNKIQAEMDIDTRFKTIESALQKDNMRIIRLEEMVFRQQEKLKVQTLTIEAQRNQINILTDRFNEQATIIRQQNEIMSAQSATIQLLKNDIIVSMSRKHKTADQDTHNSENIINSVSQPGNCCGTANPDQRGNQNHNTHVSTGRNVFHARIVRAAVTMVTFTAIKETTQNNIGVNQNIIFEHVILNEGGAYHAQHGLFIAPVSGYYLFATSLLHPDRSGPFRGGIMHNGNLVAIAFGSGVVWSQGSQTVVLKITSGDEVWIQSLYYEHETVSGEAYSSFTGVLLFAL